MPELDYDTYGFKGFWTDGLYRIEPDDPLFLRCHPLIPDRFSLYGSVFKSNKGDNRIGFLPINAITDSWTLKDFDEMMARHDISAHEAYECEVTSDDAKLGLLLRWCRDNVGIGTWTFRYVSLSLTGQLSTFAQLYFYFTDKGEASLFKLFNS